jgi:hypothetical protein
MSKKAKDEQKPREPAPVNEVPPSTCRAVNEGKTCGSTRRTDYHGIVRNPIPGTYEDGSHDEAVYRRTECLDCGRQRVDRTVERVAPEQPLAAD